MVAENIFVRTPRRSELGRCVLSLHFKLQNSFLYSNSSRSLSSYLSLEKRMLNCHKEFKAYTEFIEQYLLLDHMLLTKFHSWWVITHHCVEKVFSSTTKLKVICNASNWDSRSLFLNDRLWFQAPKECHAYSLFLALQYNPSVLRHQNDEHEDCSSCRGYTCLECFVTGFLYTYKNDYSVLVYL